jgi:hypothetical protein
MYARRCVLVGCRAIGTVVKWWRRTQEVMCVLGWMLNISNWLSFRRNSQPQGCGYDECGIAFLQYVQGSLRAAADTIAILPVALRAVAQPPRLLSWCVYPTAAFLSGRFTHNTLTYYVGGLHFIITRFRLCRANLSRSQEAVLLT